MDCMFTCNYPNNNRKNVKKISRVEPNEFARTPISFTRVSRWNSSDYWIFHYRVLLSLSLIDRKPRRIDSCLNGSWFPRLSNFPLHVLATRIDLTLELVPERGTFRRIQCETIGTSDQWIMLLQRGCGFK